MLFIRDSFHQVPKVVIDLLGMRLKTAQFLRFYLSLYQMVTSYGSFRDSLQKRRTETPILPMQYRNVNA